MNTHARGLGRTAKHKDTRETDSCGVPLQHAPDTRWDRLAFVHCHQLACVSTRPNSYQAHNTRHITHKPPNSITSAYHVRPWSSLYTTMLPCTSGSGWSRNHPTTTPHATLLSHCKNRSQSCTNTCIVMEVVPTNRPVTMRRSDGWWYTPVPRRTAKANHQDIDTVWGHIRRGR